VRAATAEEKLGHTDGSELGRDKGFRLMVGFFICYFLFYFISVSYFNFNSKISFEFQISNLDAQSKSSMYAKYRILLINLLFY
jgi:hypothetical protein